MARATTRLDDIAAWLKNRTTKLEDGATRLNSILAQRHGLTQRFVADV